MVPMVLKERDLVWNRAALASVGKTPRKGDRALADLLRAHGMVMNGGVDHLLEVLSTAELQAAARGYRFFGFNDVASVLATVMASRGGDLDEATRRYSFLVPTDGVIVERFHAVLESSPDTFAPAENLACPACGFLTVPDRVYGSYNICEVCGWEDDGVQLANPACEGGANAVSLVHAQAEALRSFPVSVFGHREVGRSPSWRPLTEEEVARANRERLEKHWLNHAVVSVGECYWMQRGDQSDDAESDC